MILISYLPTLNSSKKCHSIFSQLKQIFQSVNQINEFGRQITPKVSLKESSIKLETVVFGLQQFSHELFQGVESFLNERSAKLIEFFIVPGLYRVIQSGIDHAFSLVNFILPHHQCVSLKHIFHVSLQYQVVSI